LELERLAPQYGLLTLVSVITADNTPSIALHAQLGYGEQGRLGRAGYQRGQWRGVVFMAKELPFNPLETVV
jgi:L-amino acid N-acyltransferase YncA